MKVGFFDSGVGGLSILNAFRGLCPDVETVYLADTAHCPYGNRPAEEIVALSLDCTERLLASGCGMVVVACNTATAAAIETLRRRYPEIPFVGLEPAIKPAALRSKSGVIGVLATRGTLKGRLYNETKDRFAKGVKVLTAVADEFVEMVEAVAASDGQSLDSARLDTPANLAAVRRRIEPLLDAGADVIVLGCTHFPHLRPLIERVCAGRAEVIDPCAAVARQVFHCLSKRDYGMV